MTTAAFRLPESDIYYLPRAELRKLLPRMNCDLIRAHTDLYQADLMQKAGKIDHYYINPAIFATIHTLFQ